MRDRIPVAYFENIERFRDVKIAYPMLVYQASRSFRGRSRAELTYDVLNPATLAILFRTAKVNLAELLSRVERRLREAGLHELAGKYGRKQAPEIVRAVQRISKSRKCLYILVRSESVLVNALIDLGGLGSLSPKARTRRFAALQKKWIFQLRRLYPGTDFVWLAPDLMAAASEALEDAEELS